MELIDVVLPAFPDAPLHAALGTDTGRRREHNEDAVGAFDPTGIAAGDEPVDAALIVADGVGGHEGGAWASSFVVDAMRDTLSAQVGPLSGIDRWLDRLLHSIHEELLKEARSRGTPASMGSTATLAVVQGRALTLAHVGDSRAYRLRNGLMEQLTDDDSWVAEQVRAGVLASDAPEAEARKNVLTQCLGIGASLKVQIVDDHLSVGDRYLLCSDGLHGVVDDEELKELLARGQSPEATSRVLIDLANDRGGPDNISAVVFDIGDPPSYRVEGAGSSSEGAPHSSPETREMAALASPATRASGGEPHEAAARPTNATARPGRDRRRGNWITGAGALLLTVAAGSWVGGVGRSPAGDVAAAEVSGSDVSGSGAAATTPAPAGPSIPQAATPSSGPDPLSAATPADTQPDPVPPDTLPVDTAGAPGDTTMIPDTTGIPRDSTTAPDTTRLHTPQERSHV